MPLTVRGVEPEDIDKIRAIHERDYPDLDFPNFPALLSAFIIEDDDREIIMAGGVEALAEALLVTDKTKSRIKIGKALVEAQKVIVYTCNNYNIRELHAFTDNPNYARHLIQHGFNEREETVFRMTV